MTSPNQEFPDKAYTSSTIFGMQNVTQASVGQSQASDMAVLLDQLKATFINNLLGGFGNVVNAIGAAINKFIADLVQGLKGITGGFIDLTGFLKTTDETASGAAANGTSLSSRVLRLELELSQGATGFDDFNRSDNESSLGKHEKMPAAWTQGGNGETLGIRGAAANVKTFFTPAAGRRWARYPTPADKNQHSVTLICAARNNADRACTTIILAANQAFTEFIYCNVFGAGSMQLGRGTRSGDTWTFTQWKASTYRIGSGESITLTSDGAGKYQVVVQGDLKMEHTDTSNYPIDSSHRYAGFAMQTSTQLFADPQYSWGVETFSLRSEADTYTAISTAQQAAASVTGLATDAKTAADAAKTAADNAATRVDTVVGIAENADSKATNAASAAASAQTAADAAYAAAGLWKDEMVVSSAGVLLGKNELLLGVVQRVPSGRQRRITSVNLGLYSNTGDLVVELIRVTPARAETVIATMTVPAGTVEYEYTNIDYAVTNRDRFHFSVKSNTGVASVLQGAINGVVI